MLKYQLVLFLLILSCSEKNIKPNLVFILTDEQRYDTSIHYGNDKIIEIGSPIITGSKVEASLIENAKNRTVLIFKKRRRQNSRRKNGHRQEYSMIRINKIFSKDGKVLSEAEKISKTSKKEEVKEAVSK